MHKRKFRQFKLFVPNNVFGLIHLVFIAFNGWVGESEHCKADDEIENN